MEFGTGGDYVSAVMVDIRQRLKCFLFMKSCPDSQIKHYLTHNRKIVDTDVLFVLVLLYLDIVSLS